MMIRPDNRAGPLGANPMVGKRPVPGRGNPGAPGYGPSADPLAGLLAAYPHPQSDAQLTAQAQTQIDPILAALNARVTAGGNAIRGYTKQLAGDLGQYADSAKNIYGGAEQSQAASDAALADRLSGNGAGLAAGLADRLKGIGNGNDPSVQAAAQAATQEGAGAGNALYGKGSAALSDLFARGAGAQDYAAKLPGLADLSGQQQLGQLETKAQQDVADATSKLPDIVAALRSSNDQKQTNLAQARTGLYQWQQGRQDTADQRAQDQRTRTVLAKMASDTSDAQRQLDWSRFVIGERDRSQRAAAAEAGKNARAQAQIDARTKAADAKAATPKPPATLTTKQTNDYKGLASTIADNSAGGVPDDTGKIIHPPISAAAALQKMREHGVPDTIAIAAINRAYGTNFNPNGNLP